jgi:hypothetical protein
MDNHWNKPQLIAKYLQNEWRRRELLQTLIETNEEVQLREKRRSLDAGK